MEYNGSCHCGNIRFDVEGELTGAMSCNCSICSRKGSLLWFVPRDSFHLHGPGQGVGTYTFNKHRIKHHFCEICGIHPYAEATDKNGKPMAAVNIRCLEDFDVTSVPVKAFDGRAM